MILMTLFGVAASSWITIANVVIIIIIIKLVEHSSKRVLLRCSVAGILISKRRGSVVRASVFAWRTFPDLRLIYMVDM